MAGAPIGNQNGKKSKPWGDAIRRAIARYDQDKPEDAKYLNTLANQLLADCLNGDKAAREELTNRLDGKVAQSLTLSGDEDNPLNMYHCIERKIVRPSD